MNLEKLIIPSEFLAHLAGNRPMVCLPHESGFLLVPEEHFPNLVRNLVALQRAERKLAPLTDEHWQLTLYAIGYSRLRDFAIDLLESLAMSTNSRISDILKDQMKAEHAATGVGQPPPRGQADEAGQLVEPEQPAIPSKKYDPDELWKAVEGICKGGT